MGQLHYPTNYLSTKNPSITHLAVFFLLSLFIIITPNFDLMAWAIEYDEKRILEIGLLCIAAIATIVSKNAFASFIESIIFLPVSARLSLLAILSLGLISSLLAPVPGAALLEVCLFTLLCSLLFSVSTLTRYHPLLTPTVFCTAILCSVFFYEIIFFSGYFGAIIRTSPFDERLLFANFANVRFLNQFQIWTLPLISLPLILYRKTINSRLSAFIFILGIIWWVIIFASRGRGIQLAAAASVLLTLFIFRKNAYPLILLMGSSALFGGFIYILLFIYIPTNTTLNLSGLLNDSSRIELWSSAISMVEQHPFLGIGPQHFAYNQTHLLLHPHNSILQIASEWGIPVTILFILLLTWGGISWCKKFYDIDKTICTSENKHLWIALFCSATAGLGYSLVSGVIVMPVSQVMLVTVIGIMMGQYQNMILNRSSINKSEKNVCGWLIRAALMSAIICVLVIIKNDIIFRLEKDGPPYMSSHTGTYKPRFWQEGEIHP